MFLDSFCYKVRLLGVVDLGICFGNIFFSCDCEVRCRESKEFLIFFD